jgi:hypothetical protein
LYMVIIAAVSFVCTLLLIETYRADINDVDQYEGRVQPTGANGRTSQSS